MIVGLDNKKVETMEQLTKLLFSYKPGDEVTISLYRNAERIEVPLRLGTSPD